MNGRSFVDRRVVVNNIVPPPRDLRASADARLTPLRSEDFRPPRAETTRTFITTPRNERLVQRPEHQTEMAAPPRRIERENINPGIERHTPPALIERPSRGSNSLPEVRPETVVPQRIEPAPRLRGARPAPQMEHEHSAAPGNRHFRPGVR